MYTQKVMQTYIEVEVLVVGKTPEILQIEKGLVYQVVAKC